MTNLDSIFKSRGITLPTKVHLVKAMVFPVVMYGCEIWTVKKAEHRRIDAFELWCWRRLLRVPWTAAAAKSLQSCLTLWDPIDSIPPGSPVPGILQARTLELVAISRRSNQSILKEISPGYLLEGLMLKLKLQCFGHLMGRVDSLEKTLMLGGIGDRRRRG